MHLQDEGEKRDDGRDYKGDEDVAPLRSSVPSLAA